MRLSLCASLVLATRLSAQFVRPEDRALFTDLTYVTAVAATPAVIYVATPTALAVYDREPPRWRETVGQLDGFPLGGVTAMVADPTDDTAWLAGTGQWFRYRSFGHQWEAGPLPGAAVQVVLDRTDPARGAWFQTSLGWYFIPRGGMVALPASDVPPPGRRLGSLDAAGLRRAAPALDAISFRLLRDDQLRSYVLTAAAAAPEGNAVYVGTSGNGAFRIDPVGIFAERLPPGMLSRAAGGLALSRGRLCVGSDVRFGASIGAGAGRRGVTCLTDDLNGAQLYEPGAAVATVGAFVRDVAFGARGAIWAASETGVVRFGRGRRPVRLVSADGLPGDDARALAVDRDGVWVGTSLGLAFIRDGDRPSVTGSVSFGGSVAALALGRDTLWIGSAVGLAALPRGAAAPVAIVGHPALRDIVVGIALLGDTLVVASVSRVVWRVGGEWRDAAVAPPPVGRITNIAADGEGVWVAGSGGIAYLQPRLGTWQAFTSGADVPQPVWDVAADRDHVWASTPQGLMRYDRRRLVR